MIALRIRGGRVDSRPRLARLDLRIRRRRRRPQPRLRADGFRQNNKIPSLPSIRRMSFGRVVTMSDAISRGRLPGGDILQDAARDVSSSLSARQSLELFKLLSGFIVSCCKSSRFNERPATMKTTSSQCSDSSRFVLFRIHCCPHAVPKVLNLGAIRGCTDCLLKAYLPVLYFSHHQLNGYIVFTHVLPPPLCGLTEGV